MSGEEHEAQQHRTRQSPHEARLSRTELDVEEALAEEGAAMEQRLRSLEGEIRGAERRAHRRIDDPLTSGTADPDEIAGGHPADAREQD